MDGIPSVLDDPIGSPQETSGQTATRILRDKILAGVTTVQEVLRVTLED